MERLELPQGPKVFPPGQPFPQLLELVFQSPSLSLLGDIFSRAPKLKVVTLTGYLLGKGALRIPSQVQLVDLAKTWKAYSDGLAVELEGDSTDVIPPKNDPGFITLRRGIDYY